MSYVICGSVFLCSCITVHNNSVAFKSIIIVITVITNIIIIMKLSLSP